LPALHISMLVIYGISFLAIIALLSLDGLSKNQAVSVKPELCLPIVFDIRRCSDICTTT